MKISNESKVGALAAVSIVILILGYNFLKGENLFTKYNIFYSTFKDVDGLLVNNPVMIHGYKVGHVSRVDFNNQTLELYVEVKVDNTVRVPENSIIKIINKDMIGSKAVELIIGDAPVLARTGDTLQSQKDPAMAKAISNILTPLNEKVTSILHSLDSALGQGQLNNTISDLGLALRSFRKTADELTITLDGKGPKLNAILANVESSTSDLKKVTPKLDETVSKLNIASGKIADMDIAASLAKINQAADELNLLLEGVNNGKGSLGQLAQNKELYNNINRASIQLDSLLRDIEKNPRRYTGITERQRKKGDAAKSEK